MLSRINFYTFSGLKKIFDFYCFQNIELQIKIKNFTNSELRFFPSFH